ncbi:coiled-coil domain-containing protein [Paenibacillus sp. GXUN7292]|uniref:coiled-coil domain-containing protein n=1 Tax=Paenibacillus sp. GXUN7292 TaxID=3422499 RepID=UPI003D7CEA10
MKQINYKPLFIILLAAFTLCTALFLRPPALAEQQPFEAEDSGTQAILEKSLSLIEIDKEIDRIQEEKELLLLSLDETELLLVQQEAELSDKQEQAGKVLRAYYMGDRDFVYAALVSFESLPQWFQMLDFIEIIFASDKNTLIQYANKYDLLKENKNKLESRQQELILLEEQLHEQRSRVLALEAEVADELKNRSDAERILLLIKQLSDHWNTQGVEAVRQYFQALANAMSELPGWIQNNKQLLESKGLTYTITVPDTDLNAFLREQNQMFNHFVFEFADGQIIAKGKNEEIEISVTGHYSIEEKPKNGIIFHVDKLIFNGFPLPDTTRKQLEKDFDLGFYPQLIISFLKADEVKVEDGKLIIKLSIAL